METQVSSMSVLVQIYSNHFKLLEKYQDTSAFEKQIKQLCELEQGFLKEPNIIADLPNVEIEKLHAIYKDMLEEQLKSDPMDSDRYRCFEKNIEDIKNSLVGHTSPLAQNLQVPMAMSLENDLEIDEAENEINFVDPITKKLIKNPVRNKICNHIYGLESITAYIRTSRKYR